MMGLHRCNRSSCSRRLRIDGGGDQLAIVVVAAAVQQGEDVAGELVVGVGVGEEAVAVVVNVLVVDLVEEKAAAEGAAAFAED